VSFSRDSTLVLIRVSSPSVRKPATSTTGVGGPEGRSSGLLTPSSLAEAPVYV